VFAYTLKAGVGGLVGWTSRGGSRRAGSSPAGVVLTSLTKGVDRTTPATTAAGLRMTITRIPAKKIRDGLE
jgi:hypothetical protein